MKNFFWLLLFIFSTRIYAYPNFISYGYTSCITCHYNVVGGGPLNDYGRAVSAVAISSNVIWKKETTDTTLGNGSGFFFKKPKQSWFRPSLNIRGMRYTRNVFTNSSQSKNILMQAEGNVVLRPLKNDKLNISATFGYAPTPSRAAKNSTVSNYISREHYISYEIDRKNRFYFGFMDKVFGLRIPDHTAFSRYYTGLGQNDQSYGVVYSYITKNLELALNGFVGNLNQDESLRQKGASFFLEKEIISRLMLGTSFLKSSNNYLDQTFFSIHARVGSGEGGSVISEVGVIEKEPLLINQKKTVGLYNFSQAQMRLFRGAHLLTTFEYYRSDILISSQGTFRYGLGFQYFPAQRIELRFDLVNTRISSNSQLSTDTWDLMSQVHLWF